MIDGRCNLRQCTDHTVGALHKQVKPPDLTVWSSSLSDVQAFTSNTRGEIVDGISARNR